MALLYSVGNFKRVLPDIEKSSKVVSANIRILLSRAGLSQEKLVSIFRRVLAHEAIRTQVSKQFVEFVDRTLKDTKFSILKPTEEFYQWLTQSSQNQTQETTG